MPDLGIGELLAGALTSAGVGSATAGILAPAITSAGIGAGLSAITGGNPLVGAATGGLSAGAGGLATNLGLGEALGVSPGLAGAGAGALGGVAGAALTGGDLLTGALGGGASGYGAATSPTVTTPTPSPAVAPTPSVTAPTTTTPSITATPAAGIGGGGSSAAASALPSPITAAGALPVDLTSGAGIGGGGDPFAGLTISSGGLSSPQLGPTASSVPDVSLPQLSADIGAPVSVAAPTAAGKDSGVFGSGLNIGQALGLGAAGLGLLEAQKQRSAVNSTIGNIQTTANNAQTQADALTANAAQLESYLQTGKLPPGAQAAVDQATASAKAAIRGRYAAMGLTGSSMEAQDLANVDQQAAGQIFTLADQLYQQGANQTQLSNELYNTILSAQSGVLGAQNAQLTAASNALTNYSAAISGGPYLPKAA